MAPSAMFDAALFTRQGASSPLQLISRQFSGNLSTYSDNSEYQSPVAKLFANSDGSPASALSYHNYHSASHNDLPQLALLDINTPSGQHHPGLCSPTSLSIESSASQLSQSIHDLAPIFSGQSFTSTHDNSLVQSFSAHEASMVQSFSPLAPGYHHQPSVQTSSSPSPQMVPPALQNAFPGSLNHLSDSSAFTSALLQQQLAGMASSQEEARTMALLFPSNLTSVPSAGFPQHMNGTLPSLDCAPHPAEQQSNRFQMYMPPPPPPPARQQFVQPTELASMASIGMSNPFVSDLDSPDSKQAGQRGGKDGLVPGRDISLLDYFFNPEFNNSPQAAKGGNAA